MSDVFDTGDLTKPIKDEPLFMRGYNNYDVDKASDEVVVDFSGTLSLTQQQFAEESDINTIVERFGLTGQMPEEPHPAEYGDFTNVMDYQSALNAVIEADRAFMEFPAEVRARFGHSPQALMEFLGDAANREEAQKLGLIPKPPEVPRDVPPADVSGGK